MAPKTSPAAKARSPAQAKAAAPPAPRAAPTTGIEGLYGPGVAQPAAVALLRLCVRLAHRDGLLDVVLPSLAPALPPDAIRIAGGGVARVDQVRTLRRAGYDGVVLGRALATFGGPELLSQLGKEAPMGSPADAFAVKVEVAEPPPSVESEYAP